ncbi:MAG: signal peptide peptidase SppA [Nanoarchaeota archaeon]
MIDSKKILTVILIIAVLYIVSLGVSSILFSGANAKNKIAIIPINGPISLQDTESFGIIPSTTSSETILEFIKKAKEDDSVKGVLLDINSPGGTAVASKEIAKAIGKLEKPVVAVIREVGASGAYWIASASDYIISDELSITGSIGVIGSYLEFSKLFEEYGVTYQQLVGGEEKDIGIPYRELKANEKIKLQSKINIIHDAFIQEVARNRNIPLEKTRELATGIFYLGTEAKELGLVDGFGDKESGIAKIKELAGIQEAAIIELKEEKTILDILSLISSKLFYSLGMGFARELSIISTEQQYSIKL